MKILIGLGNPEKKYGKTRHNAGFLCADFLQKEFHFEPFITNKKMSADISSGEIESEKVLIVKPRTFMNNSGETVLKLLRFYKLLPSDIIVIHDDIDIALGKLKVSVSSRSAGHNGVQNIIDILQTQNFPRVRLGIGLIITAEPADTHDFVLQNFPKTELAELTKLFPVIKEKLMIWLNA